MVKCHCLERMRMKKNYNLETVRMVAFVMVIVIHVANYFCRGYEDITRGAYLWAVIYNVLARVSVPCFFMLTGALLLGRQETVKKSMLRAGKFLMVLAVWSVVYYLFNTYVTHQDTFTLENFLKKPAEAHLWYLYVLIPVYFVMPFLQSLCRGLDEKGDTALFIIGTVWTVGLYLMNYFDIGYYYSLPIFGGKSYIYYMFMGHLMKKYLSRIPGSGKLYFAGYLLASAATVIITFMRSNRYCQHMDGFLTYGSPIIMLSSLCFFMAILKLGKGQLQPGERTRKVMDLVSPCTLGIYICHIFFLDLYKINASVTTVSPYIALPVLTVVITLLSFALVWLLRLLPLGRKLT